MKEFSSSFLRLVPATDRPSFDYLSVDALGKGKTESNLILAASKDVNGTDVSNWKVIPRERGFKLRNHYDARRGVDAPFFISFDRLVSSTTVLGRITGRAIQSGPSEQLRATSLTDNCPCETELPAVIHMADFGSMRVMSTSVESLTWNAKRTERASGSTTVWFESASSERMEIEYDVEVVALYPHADSLPDDPVFDAFKRNFLNGIQINPRLRLLGNSAAGGSGPFALYFYSALAAADVKLAPGLSTLDVLRQTLDRYVAGWRTYGMAGCEAGHQFDFTDSYPSLVIAMADYVLPSGDVDWLLANYMALVKWTDKIGSQDLDGDGLIEYPLSGNSGSWPDPLVHRPANWWDTIGFAHKDAYGNALAYRAFACAARMALLAGLQDDVVRFEARAAQIRALYVKIFFNPDTGWLAGWRSADGQLHDYAFLFVNSLAICYDLIDHPLANDIMDRLLAKMRQVGFDRFDLGLPGNLIPVAKADYVHHVLRWGGGQRDDNQDGFQRYENGGATASYSYFTIRALYKLGRWADGDRLFAPLLRGLEAGEHQGIGENGMTRDWRAWDGTCYGYESLLADGYTALLPVLDRIKYPMPLR